MVYQPIKQDDESKPNIPSELPVIPLVELVLYPHMIFPLHIARDIALAAIDLAIKSEHRMVCLLTQKEKEVDEITKDKLYCVGLCAGIMKMLKLPQGGAEVLVQGLARVKVKNIKTNEGVLIAEIEPLQEEILKENDQEIKALMRAVKTQIRKNVELGKILPQEFQLMIYNIDQPGLLADLAAASLDLKVKERQSLLETIDPKKRLKKVNEFLAREHEILEMENKIKEQVQGKLKKAEKDYLLREQLNAIQKELGEADPKIQLEKEYKEKIKKAKMPKEVEKVALKELQRLTKMHSEFAEANVIRTYLDTLVALPWKKSTKDNHDLKKAKKILDEDHYGLKDIKERILEYLGVKKLKKDSRGPILCFVGPPGVGKTSMGRSIARAMNRKFFRTSLGGIRDEAEIRGHRRTYVGAMPGRIISGIKTVGVNNPVFMLDEIDKLGADFRGDPASAMLELLDPEQNVAFVDNYLSVPFDLSKVMFIMTANMTDTIPSPLLDRMEVIYLSGYTELEKLKIARKYLVPKQIKEHGLSLKNIKFKNEGLLKIIREYTKEAGLRNLERAIAKICRKAAKLIALEKRKKFIINEKQVVKFLGVPKFEAHLETPSHPVGTATGLAWTPLGGEILYIEAAKMKGKGNLILTGKLGEVMQESAKAALSFARVNAKKLLIDENFYENYDIHVHVPEGGIPKDGPSAGITIATAIISALTEKPVRTDIAMTGEITIHGEVMKIGGLKEKLLAAARARIKHVIIPYENLKDLKEIPDEIKKPLKIRPVKKMSEVLKHTIKEFEKLNL